MKKLLLLALWGFLSAAHAGDETLRFYGYAYDLDSNKYLYTESHEHRAVDGKWIGGTVAYIAADGSPMGRKTLDFANDSTVPLYRLDLVTDGYVEGITANKDGITMIRRKQTGAEMETKTVPKSGMLAADAGFHSFLIQHFDELLAGKTVKFRFVAAGELDTFKFRAQRIGDTTFEGKPAVRFMVEPDSFLRLLADPLEVTYDPKTRDLLEYRGLSNVHDPKTGETYESVRIAYYSVPPPDAPKLPPLN